MAYGLNPNEGRSRFAKLGMAINDELSQAYRDLLEMNVDPKDMNAVVKSEDIFRNLSANQRLLLSQTATSGYKELDISLMYKLLRNICKNIPRPTNGWGGDSMPKEGENTVGDDIERIRLIRNEAFGHVSSASTTKDTFDKRWLIISKICTRLQLYTGKNYLNGLQNIREQSLKKEDELAEIERIKTDCQRDVELRDLIMSLKRDVQELKKPTRLQLGTMDFESIKTWTISWITWPFSLVNQIDEIKEPIIGAVAGWATIWFLIHIVNTILVYMAIFILVFSIAERDGVTTIHWDKLRGLLSGRQNIRDATKERIPGWNQAIQEFLTKHMLFSFGYILGLVVGIKF